MTARLRGAGLRLVVALLVLGAAAPGLSCDSPPQIVDIQPARGAQDVRTNEPIRIRFDRPVDRASVASRFSITPAAAGSVGWDSTSTLVFRHETLRTDTQYEVALAPGYRDLAGRANGLRHSWQFRTEAAPVLRATVPASDERNVDPGAYLSFTFSRDVDANSFGDAVSIAPAAAYSVRADPNDGRRLLVAPRRLLDPNTAYTITVGGDARDADGNRMPPFSLRFTTGPPRPLTRWITFIASASDAAGAGAGVWMVDELGFPRKLEDGPVAGFALAPGGGGILLRRPDDAWEGFDLEGAATGAGFAGRWAVGLADAGYAYLDGGDLVRLLPGGTRLSIDHGVVEASASPDLGRLAYVVNTGGGAEVRGYDIALRAHYRIAAEAAPLSNLRWNGAGTILAYLAASGPGAERQLRVRSLAGTGSTTTVATGEIVDGEWLGSGPDLVFSAQVTTPSGPQLRIFRVSLATPITTTLKASSSLGQGLDAEMFSPRPSPDGHQLAFLVGEAASAQVWLMNADGTGLRRLTAYDAESFPFACRDLHWAG